MISHAFMGVQIHPGSAGLVLQGNYIGTTLNGMASAGNMFAVNVYNTPNVKIGGTAAGERNVISGNLYRAISLYGALTDGTIIRGNYIGVGPDGTTPVGNLQAISIDGAVNTAVGGVGAGAPNIIANTAYPTVLVISGTGNTIRGNVFADNNKNNSEFPAIVLGSSYPVLNDAGDADTGANNLQNYPVLTGVTASSGDTRVAGTLNSNPGSTFILDFYANTSCHASGYGEGKTYLGAKTVNTDGSGNVTFNATGLSPIAAGNIVTATATDAGGNTSQFSACHTAVAAAAAALVVTTSSVSVDAGGPGSGFAVALASVPASTVTVNFVYDASRLSVSPGSLTFQANGTATTPQAVTVRAISGVASGGTQGVASSLPISLPIAITSTSSDAAYNGLTSASVLVTVADDGPPPCGPSTSNPSVKTAVANGALEVTITSANNASNRNLTQLQFGAMQNAQVTYNGQPVSSGQTVNLPANATTAIFTVRRTRPGQATTVPLVVVDGCGSLPTFVGGGTGAGF